jgi:aldose 1-epimerase
VTPTQEADARAGAPLEIARIVGGNVEVEVIPAVGARLHRVRVAGHDLLRTPPDVRTHLTDPYYWGSYVMAPWCNRIAAGRTPGVAGRDLDLPPSFPDGTAIHGQVSRAAWIQVDDRTFRIRAGGDGWPWPYDVVQRLTAGENTLELALSITNLADGPMPAGLGMHPWFIRPAVVRIDADSVFPSNLDTKPDAEPVRGILDRRAAAELPDGLDAAWTDLRDPPVTLEWPSARLRATMTTTPATDYIVAASPAGVDAVAVEPETHAPAGIRRLLNGEPGGLTLLPAGETRTLAIRFAFTADT